MLLAGFGVLCLLEEDLLFRISVKCGGKQEWSGQKPVVSINVVRSENSVVLSRICVIRSGNSEVRSGKSLGIVI